MAGRFRRVRGGIRGLGEREKDETEKRAYLRAFLMPGCDVLFLCINGLGRGGGGVPRRY